MFLLRKVIIFGWIGFLIILVGEVFLHPAQPTGAAWRLRVDNTLYEQALQDPDQPVDFIVFMAEQADLSQAKELLTKEEKSAHVFAELTGLAARTQAPLLAELERLGVEYRSYWVANMVWGRGVMNVVEQLARRSDVAYLYANPRLYQQETDGDFTTLSGGPSLAPAGLEWNLEKVGAPAVWAAGFTGQGVVIGGQDTGYDWDHPALINAYRGWDGAAANHDYSWHDAIHTNDLHTLDGNLCGYDSLEPCDDGTHGTHTMGIMVGDDGAGNQIGMAPGAQWIGCRNMEEGWGTPVTYSECFEWFIAPYAASEGSTSGDPAKAPHIVNNSWGCPPSEGCELPEILQQVVENTRAAGILVVASAGNEGYFGCETVKFPAAIYDASFTVGSTNNQDIVSSFSSRGPVTVDGSSRLKPDITAPGSSIRSSITGGGYAPLSGTSMAAPHVAGLAALLISAQPELAGNVDLLEEIMRQTAAPLTSEENCGAVPGSSVPNNTYGWGRIDAWNAYQSMFELHYLYLPLMEAAPIE